MAEEFFMQRSPITKILLLVFALFLIGPSTFPAPLNAKANTNKTAIFAMGCFWCAESDFEKVPGVIKVVSGYTGGHVKNPTYDEVGEGSTGHYEAVLVTYNPDKVTYAKLITNFWKNVDPFDGTGQFCDKGHSYKAVIFPSGKAETDAANASKEYLAKSFKRDIATQIIERVEFYPAEEYHQDYYKKNPIRYHYYRSSCGRDARLRAVWGKKS
jgi:peptide-methionine (S)-S-oxide reductase